MTCDILRIEVGNNVFTFSIGRTFMSFILEYAKNFHGTKRRGIKVLAIQKGKSLTFSIEMTLMPFILQYAKLYYMTKRKGIKIIAIEKGKNFCNFSIEKTFVPFLLEYARLLI